MTVAELLTEISQRGGDVRAIYTGIGNPEDRYAIVRSPHGWQVFYSERGQSSQLRAFSDEPEACKYLLKLLEGDATIWQAQSQPAMQAMLSVEQALVELKNLGATPVEAIKALHLSHGLSLAEANRMFSLSPAWARETTIADQLHAELIAALAKEPKQ